MNGTLLAAVVLFAAPALAGDGGSTLLREMEQVSRDIDRTARRLAVKPKPVTLAQAEARLSSALGTVLRAYPGLAGKPVMLRPYEAKDKYFRAWVDGWWGRRAGRTYVVLYNLELLKDMPPDEALRGIVAHEVAHLEQFAGMSGWGLFFLALPYSIFEKSEASHERATDLIALERGFARELLLYKRWVYARSEDREKARRNRVYLSPEEIELWLETPSRRI